MWHGNPGKVGAAWPGWAQGLTAKDQNVVGAGLNLAQAQFRSLSNGRSGPRRALRVARRRVGAETLVCECPALESD